MNGLDLFSGIGGLTLALSPWVTPVAYCERDRYAQAVLVSRVRSGDLPDAPIWDDVRTLSPADLPDVDIIYGGFPCQDISTAGRGGGLGGERSGLYLEIERLIRETKPTFVFLENVPAIRTRGLGRVVWGLSELGYDLRWTIVSAAEVGAPHLRKRWFMLGRRSDSDCDGRQGLTQSDGKPLYFFETQGRNYIDGLCDALADAQGKRSKQRTRWCWRESEGASAYIVAEDWWAVEPGVGRVVDELSHRVDRLRGLGNSVVPAQAREAFMRLAGLK